MPVPALRAHFARSDDKSGGLALRLRERCKGHYFTTGAFPMPGFAPSDRLVRVPRSPVFGSEREPDVRALLVELAAGFLRYLRPYP
jgi:hypothetical protein